MTRPTKSYKAAILLCTLPYAAVLEAVESAAELSTKLVHKLKRRPDKLKRVRTQQDDDNKSVVDLPIYTPVHALNEAVFASSAMASDEDLQEADQPESILGSEEPIPYELSEKEEEILSSHRESLDTITEFEHKIDNEYHLRVEAILNRYRAARGLDPQADTPPSARAELKIAYAHREDRMVIARRRREMADRHRDNMLAIARRHRDHMFAIEERHHDEMRLLAERHRSNVADLGVSPASPEERLQRLLVAIEADHEGRRKDILEVYQAKTRAIHKRYSDDMRSVPKDGDMATGWPVGRANSAPSYSESGEG